ncbi:uncharacterized protein LOC128246680 [Mya arenaria]|uniref:uncharacterized protein LOC128246680 n=1 Tax=Mya arenaria TaxID=6604 RepID=UPI0022E1909A|nr:uncharacterized protein LOC128246680 [Mya arenaria]
MATACTKTGDGNSTVHNDPSKSNILCPSCAGRETADVDRHVELKLRGNGRVKVECFSDDTADGNPEVALDICLTSKHLLHHPVTVVLPVDIDADHLQISKKGKITCDITDVSSLDNENKPRYKQVSDQCEQRGTFKPNNSNETLSLKTHRRSHSDSHCMSKTKHRDRTLSSDGRTNHDLPTHSLNIPCDEMLKRQSVRRNKSCSLIKENTVKHNPGHHRNLSDTLVISIERNSNWSKTPAEILGHRNSKPIYLSQELESSDYDSELHGGDFNRPVNFNAENTSKKYVPNRNCLDHKLFKYKDVDDDIIPAMKAGVKVFDMLQDDQQGKLNDLSKQSRRKSNEEDTTAFDVEGLVPGRFELQDDPQTTHNENIEKSRRRSLEDNTVISSDYESFVSGHFEPRHVEEHSFKNTLPDEEQFAHSTLPKNFTDNALQRLINTVNKAKADLKAEIKAMTQGGCYIQKQS